MRDVIQKWYDWLQQACPERRPRSQAEVATSSEKNELAHVYSDGRQLWASDGYRLHARQVATGKQGQVTLNEDGLFQVNENGRLPNFAASLPQSQPATSIVVQRDKLLQALAGQDQHVRLTFYAEDQVVELSSAGAYALVMLLTGLDEEDFWRPERS
jgi:hypothetical protein